MPICGHCGERISPGAKFCPECGTPLQILATQSHPARKTVTIVFSDLVDSTVLGEELDAESLREVMDNYFEAMRSVLERHGGVVEKFIGDAVMAVFGLPRMHEDDALRAVRAALGMRDALADLNQNLSSERGVTLSSRTGVNTGVVVVGNSAGGQRLATGDAVNVAARLEQAAPADGIVLGPDTFRLVSTYVEARTIGPLSLKGKSETVSAWQLIRLVQDDERLRFGSTRPLIGRLTELTAVEARFNAAASAGSAETVLVVGEPGVGKSRLAREIIDRLGPAATVLSAACQPYGTSTFWPVAELLGCLSDASGPLNRAQLEAIAADAPAADRKAIVERVGSLLGLSDAAFPLEESFWATARLFASVSSRRPLVLVLEDVHWAELTMLDLLDHLRLHTYPVGTLILATARPEVLDVRYADDELLHMEVIRLPALAAAESDELIDRVLGSSSLSANARALIHRAAEGNPLFVEQALATWIEEGVLAPATDGWTVTRAVTAVRMPVSVSAIFAARLDRLPDDERLVMGAGSVAGATFELAALRSMLPRMGSSDVDGCLQRLIRSGLLLSSNSDAKADEFVFEHASLRDVAYEMTLKSDRAFFHERFAEWIENSDGTASPEGLIGHHLAEAYAYHAQLRRADVNTLQLAFRGAQYLVSDCQRALLIGDRAGAEKMTGRIVGLLSACGPALGSTDLNLMAKTAKLLVTMGQWRAAVTLLTPYVALGHGPLLRDLGVALCQLNRPHPESADYREGQRLLELAGAPPNRDIDALASLAGTWKGVDDARAIAVYGQCLALDPSDPYALGNFLEYQIAAAGDLSVVEDMRDQISAASRRCRAQADDRTNLPWAFFDSGKFALLLGDPYQAIGSYAKAVQLTTADHMLVTSLASLDRLERLAGEISGLGWARRLLAIARAVRFPSEASLAGVGNVLPLREVAESARVLMVAGGTEATADAWLERHGKTLTQSFERFNGVVISGGTVHGVAGFVGSLRENVGTRMTAIGYLPADIPTDDTVDTRYDQLRRTVSTSYSIAESLQAWADLIASGYDPTRVKLLAVNGGTIARAEYVVALALGCRVGVVAGSGRAADNLLDDGDWSAVPNLVRLGLNVEAISRFVTSDV